MSRINVSRIVKRSKFASTLTVSRAGGSYDATGIWTQTAASQFDVTGTVLPASIEETEQLQAGGVNEEVIKLLTDVELQLETDTNAADRLEWNGRSYKILRVKDNNQFGFRRYYAVKEKV
tara:strand:- start:2342 stop:2701 length:360 start_codon:yes stop_codon:yes gene_type:complete